MQAGKYSNEHQARPYVKNGLKNQWIEKLNLCFEKKVGI